MSSFSCLRVEKCEKQGNKIKGNYEPNCFSENTQPCWSEVETSLNLLTKVNTDVNNEIDCTHEHK